jgi:hypothetical protein
VRDLPVDHPENEEYDEEYYPGRDDPSGDEDE